MPATMSRPLWKIARSFSAAFCERCRNSGSEVQCFKGGPGVCEHALPQPCNFQVAGIGNREPHCTELPKFPRERRHFPRNLCLGMLKVGFGMGVVETLSHTYQELPCILLSLATP